MEIHRNFYNRFNINHVDDQFKKNEKVTSGIAGYHGKLANIVGWILENIFHKTVHVTDKDGKIYYFNCNSLGKWLERRNVKDFKNEDLHNSQWVQTTIDTLQKRVIGEKAKKGEPISIKSDRIEEVVENAEGLEEIKTSPKALEPEKLHRGPKNKSNKQSVSPGKISRVEELEESQKTLPTQISSETNAPDDELLKNLKDPLKARTLDKQGRTLLDIAIEEGNLNAVKYAVETLKWDVNKLNRNNLTPLHYAAKKGNKEIVEVLLKNGALNIPNKFDTSPSAMAIDNQHLEIAELIRNRTRKA